MIRLAAFLAVLMSAIWSPAGILLADEHAACAAAPEPVVELRYVSRYEQSDETRATIDPLREAEAEAAVAPLDDFIVMLATGLDRIYAGPAKARMAAADCVLEQIAAWAEADALSRLETETVRLTVGSRYAAFALILWQTLPYAHDHPSRQAILDWLDRRMHEQILFWQDAAAGARQGNLRAWAGLAAAAVSVQTGDAEMRDWAKVAILDVLCSANADGSLPQEMTRGRLALHYQLHAIAPLVTAAAILERQGVPVSRDCEGALHRVVEFAVRDLDDGSRTRDITGIEQNLFDGTDKLQPFQLAWIEPYLVLAEDERLEALRGTLGALSYSKLGGNQTELWGR